MLRQTFFFSLLAIGCGASSNLSSGGRIIGGEDGGPVAAADYPFMVAIVHKTEIICGATIINDIYALTAASCVKKLKPAQLYLISGTISPLDDKEVHEVTYIYVYGYYNEKTGDNNVAVIKVKQPFPSDWRVTLNPKRPGNGVEGTILGWGVSVEEGSDKSKNLQKGKVTTTLRSACIRAHYPIIDVTERMICALGDPTVKDPSVVVAPCEGDYGGPLLIGQVGAWKQAGIAVPSQGCGRDAIPSLYTDVTDTRIHDWLVRYLPKM